MSQMSFRSKIWHISRHAANIPCNLFNYFKSIWTC